MAEHVHTQGAPPASFSWAAVVAPGASERFVAKLPTSGAHAAILDLEDGLDPADRAAAHARVRGARRARGRGWW